MLASLYDGLVWLRALEDSASQVELAGHLLEAARSAEVAADHTRIYEWDAARGVLMLAHSATAAVAATPAVSPDDDSPRALPRIEEILPERLDPLTARAWRERGMVWGEPDADPAPWGPARALGAVAFRSGLDREWLMVVSYTQEPDAERRAAFATLAQAARLAGRALEWRETARRRGGQRAALADLAHGLANAGHVLDALRAGARAAFQGSGARGAALWRITTGGLLRLDATAGGLAERESLGRALQPLAECVVEAGRTRCLDRALDEPCLSPEAAARFGRVCCLPLIGHGRVLGALAVFDTGDLPIHAVFDAHDDEFLRAVADQLATLLGDAERAELLRQREQELREARARARRRERLATLGEMAARIAEEARLALASIGAFARRAHRELPTDEPRREYLEVVIRETERLERMLGEPIAAGQLGAPNFRLESLNAVLQEVLPGVGEKLVRRRVRLLKRLDPEAPRLLLDADKIRQVLRNLIEHAVDSVPIGGRVRIETRAARDHVVAEIAFDGRREPGGLIERLFVPFAGGTTGPSLGMGVADQIVREHGGEIRVRSDADWGAAVLLTLPIRGNGDRRAPGSERRQSRLDRRQRIGEA